ncbi:hypothetical protein XENOCAPTIV_023603 [Xenoophorus captivus]|uniref:Ig-like domain-containing protein n=1 Tax=Xenoophorus captivus TaxID=1517983 RepID=A0ABV0QVK6_9TELE
MGDVHRRGASTQTRSGRFKQFSTVSTGDGETHTSQFRGKKSIIYFQCINNVARKMGMNHSLDLPDKTLQFIRDRPLMDEAVRPLTGGPLLLKRGPLLTRIKAVNFDGEMFIIEQIQVYENPVAINILRLSSSKTNLVFVMFIGPIAAVDFALIPGNNIQLPCQLHSNLAQVHWRFSDLHLQTNNKYYIYSRGLLILNTSTSDAGLYFCDSVEQINSRIYNRTVAVYHLQVFEPPVAVSPSPGITITKYFIQTSKTATNGSQPDLEIEELPMPENQSNTGKISRLEVAVALLSLFCLSLIGVILWFWKQGRWKCFGFAQNSKGIEGKRPPADYTHIQNRNSEIKPLGAEAGRPCTANNNHTSVNFKGNGEYHFPTLANISSLDGLRYIYDESEI